MFFMNEALKLQNTKLQLNNLNIQFDTFLTQIQSGLITNIGVVIEDISLKLLNLGLEMLNIEMQSNNIFSFNSTVQIKNIGNMIQNIAFQMQNMNLMKMPINAPIPFPNIMLNNNNIPEINIIFKTVYNDTTPLTLKCGTTVWEMIEKYCNEKGISINNKSIVFIYNAVVINKNDLRPIENVFKDINKSHVIIVNNADDLIGG